MPTVSPIISDEGVVNDMKTTFKSGLNDDFSNDDTMSIFSLQYIIFAVVILCLICIVIALAIKISKNNKNKKKAKIENKLRETQGVIRCTSDSMQTTENTMRNIEMHTFETTETHKTVNISDGNIDKLNNNEANINSVSVNINENDTNKEGNEEDRQESMSNDNEDGLHEDMYMDTNQTRGNMNMETPGNIEMGTKGNIY
eukprot:31221_1